MSTSRAPAPRKALGQHFLVDLRVVRKIVDLLELDAVTTIVEIGPGRGALTRELLLTGRRVVAVEPDLRMVAHLQERYPEGLEIVQDDIRNVAAQALVKPARKKAILVGNLPYNLSGPILEWIFQSAKRWHQVVLTLQLEVVKRLVAEPATREFGPLAVARALHFVAAKRHIVRPGAFFPPPKVTSAIVELRPTPRPPLAPKDPAHFMQIVHALFAHRRKNMRNNLKLGLAAGDEVLDGVFASAGVDGRRRAEQLTWHELSALYAACRTSRL
jgi:16S rRNA (adenine1518-N6/adenine1519-N6)-dimethyltransferase